MLYLKCPSSKTMLGNIELIYLREKTKIENKNISLKEKGKLLSEMVKKLGLLYCCNLRLTTYKDTVLLIK